MNQTINQRGQSLIEVIVALGIFTVSLAASFQLFFGGQNLSSGSVNTELALNYAQEGIEAVRTIRDRSWAELTAGDHGLEFNGYEWMFGSSSTSDSKDIFTRTVFVYDVAENIKIASTTISWLDGGSTKTLVIVEELTNWESPLQTSCKTQPLSGNWATPQTIATGDLGAGNVGQDIIVKYPYAYMAGFAASSAKPDIFVFDVSNPSGSLPILKSIDIGAGGTNYLAINGDYLYAASNNDSKEFLVFDISDPANMSLVTSLDLSGSSNAISVATYSNVAVVGRLESASYQLTFIDISNPSSPQIVAEFSGLDDVHDFAVTDQYLYVMEDSGTDIRIYDISNPNSPTYVTGFNIDAIDYYSSYLFYKGGNRHLLLGGNENEFQVVGASTTDSMYVRDQLDMSGTVNDIVCAVGDLAFLATSNSNKEFTIVNVADPDNIVEYSSLNYPQIGTGIDYYNNVVYMSVRSNDSLRVITSTP